MTALLIVYRVACGQAWSEDTHAVVTGRRAVSTLQFTTAPSTHGAQNVCDLDSGHAMDAEKSDYAPQDIEETVRSVDKGGQVRFRD